MYDVFNNERYPDTVKLCRKYELFPDAEEWRGRILLLETSEEKPSPESYEKMVTELKAHGVFDAVSGVLVGKPQDKIYEEEYKDILLRVIDDPELPVVWNINVGHASPRCIIPFGVDADVDVQAQRITFNYEHSELQEA